MGAQNELQDNNIILTPEPMYWADPQSLGELYFAIMPLHKGQVAQIYGPTGETDTFDELFQRSIRTAITMQNLGVEPGDYISICSYNHLDSCTPLIASFFTGAIMAALDSTLSTDDITHLLKQTPPKLIFVGLEAVEMIEKVLKSLKLNTKIVVFGDTTQHIPFSDFLKPNKEENTFRPRKPDSLEETAIVYFTSGTSGFPKGVRYSQRALCLGSTRKLPNSGFNASIIFAYASTYWSVFHTFLNISIMTGGTRIVYPKFDLNCAWDLFKYKPTMIFLNPMQIMSMIKQGRPENLDISSVEDIVVAGGCLKYEQMSEVKKALHETRVHSVYGQTEILGSVTLFQPGHPEDLELLSKKITSCGRPCPGMSYKVVDLETEKPLGPNQKGELRVKSQTMFSSYVNVDSSDLFDSDGFLKTGDEAYYDEDKCFYVMDRVKEMFKYKGFHISPAVVESVVLTHPAVEGAVVIGKPHDIDGDHPMAIVKVKSTHVNTTPESIEKYVEEKVSDRQRLRAGVKFIDEIPVLPTGKPNRKLLRKIFA